MTDEIKSGTVVGWVICPDVRAEGNKRLMEYLSETGETHEIEHHFVDAKGVPHEGYWCSAIGREHRLVGMVEGYLEHNPQAKFTFFKIVYTNKGNRYRQFSFKSLKKRRWKKLEELAKEKKAKLSQ